MPPDLAFTVISVCLGPGAWTPKYQWVHWVLEVNAKQKDLYDVFSFGFMCISSEQHVQHMYRHVFLVYYRYTRMFIITYNLSFTGNRYGRTAADLRNKQYLV